MPSLELAICGIPITISTSSARLTRLFADYFQYYDPQINTSVQVSQTPLSLELKLRRELPPRQKLIPAEATLISQTGIARLWREAKLSGERFHFDYGVAAFRVEPAQNRAIGLITPEALQYPHILANTYTLFPLLLLLRSRSVYHLHAAAVLSPDDKLWLICGAQRSGKTTLATALGLAGWRPISDDSMLVHFDGETPQLTALKKYFHIAAEVLERWSGLREITWRHQYLDRVCIEGLEFFGTRKLADTSFKQADHVLLPEITQEKISRLAPAPPSQALLRLGEQSAFFQLWSEHTARQWKALTILTRAATGSHLSSASDAIASPEIVASMLAKN